MTAVAAGRSDVTHAAAGRSAPAAARARGLRKVFHRPFGGRTVAVDGVDLDIPAGAVLGLLGPNGSGKTTLIRLLLGLSRPTGGCAELLGEPIPARAAAALPHVGALVEGPGFHPFLSGRENLLRCAAAEPLLARREIAGAVSAALDRVGLTDAARRAYRGYSMGMKQRLGLAAVLLVPRQLVVLDEPTNGLDPAGTRDVRRVIAELHSAGATVLVSSHLLAEVEATCTHVAVLQDGAVVATGELTALLDSDAPELVVTTQGRSADALAALRAAGLSAHLEGQDVIVHTSSPGRLDDPPDPAAPAAIAALVHAGIPVYEARRRRTGLDELFARLTEGDAERASQRAAPSAAGERAPQRATASEERNEPAAEKSNIASEERSERGAEQSDTEGDAERASQRAAPSAAGERASQHPGGTP